MKTQDKTVKEVNYLLGNIKITKVLGQGNKKKIFNKQTNVTENQMKNAVYLNYMTHDFLGF